MSNPYEEERTPLLIEFSKTQEEGLTSVRNVPPPESRDELEKLSNIAMDKALIIMQNTAQKVKSAIKSMGNEDGRPDHVEVEFAIKCDSDYGVMLATTLNEANLNVKLTWNNLGR